MVETVTIEVSTRGNTDVIDLTAIVAEKARQCAVVNGLVTVFSPSSTSGVTTVEYESGCISDLKRMFEQIAPGNISYAHNARWGDGNGHSHMRASLLGPSLSIPVVNRRLLLGTWQQIILVDFDTRPRRRQLVLQFLGE